MVRKKLGKARKAWSKIEKLSPVVLPKKLKESLSLTFHEGTSKNEDLFESLIVYVPVRSGTKTKDQILKNKSTKFRWGGQNDQLGKGVVKSG